MNYILYTTGLQIALLHWLRSFLFLCVGYYDRQTVYGNALYAAYINIWV